MVDHVTWSALFWWEGRGAAFTLRSMEAKALLNMHLLNE